MKSNTLLDKIYHHGFGLIQKVWHWLKSDYPLKVKVVIFYHIIRLNVKFILFSKIFGLKSERFLGMTFTSFSYYHIKYLFEDIFFKNEYFFHSPRKDPVIIDCGANIGMATLFFKWLFPESTVYAFEPDPSTFDILQKNVSDNRLTKVHLFNKALSHKNGKIDFYIDPETPGSLLMSAEQGRMSGKKISVESVSLASFIQKEKITSIDFLKLDVEGSEEMVLMDLSKKKVSPRISKGVIEYHHHVPGHPSMLSSFLGNLEDNGFQYQLNTQSVPIHAEDFFQDILIYFYRRS